MRTRRQVEAIPVDSREAVDAGAPGSFYISKDRKELYLRCPCGRCDKRNSLNLDRARGSYTWSLSGKPDKPSISPSIHWMEKDGRKTHWHGWLKNGVFEG